MLGAEIAFYELLVIFLFEIAQLFFFCFFVLIVFDNCFGTCLYFVLHLETDKVNFGPHGALRSAVAPSDVLPPGGRLWTRSRSYRRKRSGFAP